MATVPSSFLLLPQRALQASARRLLFHLQLPHPAVSAPMDTVVALTSTSVKAQHLATAVALRATAVQLPVTALRDARLDLGLAFLPISLQTEPAGEHILISAKAQSMATAAARLATAAQLQNIALLAAR
jgi:hypothetical protein